MTQIELCSHRSFSRTKCNSSLLKLMAISMPLSITCFGHFWLVYAILKLFKRIFSNFSFVTKLQILRANEYGILVFECFEWHELKSRYCLLLLLLLLLLLHTHTHTHKADPSINCKMAEGGGGEGE